MTNIKEFNIINNLIYNVVEMNLEALSAQELCNSDYDLDFTEALEYLKQYRLENPVFKNNEEVSFEEFEHSVKSENMAIRAVLSDDSYSDENDYKTFTGGEVSLKANKFIAYFLTKDDDYHILFNNGVIKNVSITI